VHLRSAVGPSASVRRWVFGCLGEQGELLHLLVDRDPFPSPGRLDVTGWGGLSVALRYCGILLVLPGHRLSFSRCTTYRCRGTRQNTPGKIA